MSNCSITISASDEVFRVFAKEVADNISTSAVAEDIDLRSLAIRVSDFIFAQSDTEWLRRVAHFIDTDELANAVLSNEDLRDAMLSDLLKGRSSSTVFDNTEVSEKLAENLDYRKLAEEIVRALGVSTNRERKQNA